MFLLPFSLTSKFSMAECEVPSFSLGFDLDLEDTPPHSPKPDPNLIVPDSESDPETRPVPPRHIFRRLRRGLPSSSVRRQTEPPPCIDMDDDNDDDDDIEEFSDEPVQESARSSVRNRAICRSSKVSLKSIGVLTPHSSTTNSRDKKRKLDLEVPDSVGLENGRCGSMFRKLMTSPLRRFQLVESDDDDMVGEGVNGGNKLGLASSKGPICNRNIPVTSLERDSKTEVDDVNHNKENFPINLSPLKNFPIPRDKQASAELEMGKSGLVFPDGKLAASPLRRFQLLDSDDDDMVGEDVNGGNEPGPASPMGPMCNRNTPVISLEQDGKKQFDDFNRNKKDLPTYLSPVKIFSIPRDKQSSVGLDTGQSGSVFPNGKLAASPLCRFQLIESDDDDEDMVGDDVNSGNKPGLASSTGPMCNRNKPVISLKQDSKKQFDNVNQNKVDFPTHLSQVKNFSIPRDKQASAGLETGQSGSVFPNGKLAARSLHRCQLVDSDDDDVMVCGVKVGPSTSIVNRNRPPSSLKQDKKVQFVDADQNQKYLSPVKNFSIPTPAFNDVCEEYFHSAKSTQVPKSDEPYRGANSGCQKAEQTWEAAGPLPPAHRYFFHDNPRIQQLVRSRLCNFSPLGDNTVNQQENIDYMGQFDNGGSTSRRSKSKNLNDSDGWVDPKIIPSSTRKKATKRNNTKSNVSKSKNNETSKLNSSNDSASWVEPKDAGQRRVQASDELAGHWYTGSDGRKVYVNKSGKESTGRNAYRNYRKESGATPKKSKKKTTAKKGK